MTPLHFFSRQLRDDPLATYARVRSEPGLHRTPVGTWVATRYDDVRDVLTSPAASSRVWAMATMPAEEASGPLFDPRDRAHAVTSLMRHWLPFTDAPTTPRCAKPCASHCDGSSSASARSSR